MTKLPEGRALNDDGKSGNQRRQRLAGLVDPDLRQNSGLIVG